MGGGGRHTGHAALERVFPALGPLTDARWTSSRDHDDRGLPSPDLVIVGPARLAPGRLGELTAAHLFVPGGPAEADTSATSWCTAPLDGQGPEDPEWVRSDDLDLDRGGDGHRATPWFDRRSDTVRLHALNPGADQGTPTAGGSAPATG